MLNLFYEEPDPDRWIPLDRYPRRWIRRAVRGPPRPGGQMRVFLNLCAGLDKLGVPYRVNDYRYADKHPDELVCIIGKSLVLWKVRWKNPILLGASFETVPIDIPDLFSRAPVKKVLVPGEWVVAMARPWWGNGVLAWPVGIDTDRWVEGPASEKSIDVLIYDKILWHHERFEEYLLAPIRKALTARSLRVREIRYGHYREEEYLRLVRSSRAMVFLVEHETQGLAYQQALSSGVPIMAWDQGGFWQDPEVFPERVLFEPVTSVPYWDARCGMKFADTEEFLQRIDGFLSGAFQGAYSPRNFILENLTLEACAQKYLDIAASVAP